MDQWDFLLVHAHVSTVPQWWMLPFNNGASAVLRGW